MRRPDLDKFLDGPLDTDTEQTVLVRTTFLFRPSWTIPEADTVLLALDRYQGPLFENFYLFSMEWRNTGALGTSFRQHIRFTQQLGSSAICPTYTGKND